MRLSFFRLFTVVALIGFLWSPKASANPEFSHTESGEIRIEENGTDYAIYSADRSVGAFNRFGNEAGEAIRSIQASPDHSVVFKVTGTEPSVFFGSLSANSHVFLVNPNGIVFGPGSSVNAPGLVAAAMDLESMDWNKKEMVFRAPLSGGVVQNSGHLSAASGGYVALIGSAVQNRGVIEAPGGSASLVSAQAATVGLDPDGVLSIKVTEPLRHAVYAADGSRVADGILNTGTVSAKGGHVLLTAGAMEEVFDQVINHQGVLEANTVEERNGVIILSGGPEGIVSVNGVVRAAGDQIGEKGGQVQITGSKIALMNDAAVDASGSDGGGQVLIGGDYHGENPAVQNARAVAVAPGAVISADAVESGNGGRVIVWSDEATNFYGAISARGGLLEGDGGFAEVSSLKGLGYYGEADLITAAGEAGTLLLDPPTVTLHGGSGDGASDGVSLFNGGVSGSIFFVNSTIFNVYETEIEAQSASANIVLEAQQSISTTGTFASGLTLASNRNLTIRTRNNATDGTGSIDLTGSTAGANLLIRTVGTGSITIEGSAALAGVSSSILVPNLQTDTGDITISTRGPIDLKGTLTTAGGNVDIDTLGVGTIFLRNNMTTQTGDVSVLAGGSDIIKIIPSSGTSLAINTSGSTLGGDVSLTNVLVAGVNGLDLTINTSGVSTGDDGGDVTLGRMAPDTNGSSFNDLTINAAGFGGGSAGTVTLQNRAEFGEFSTDLPDISITGALAMQSGSSIWIPKGTVGIVSDTHVYLGYINEDSNVDGIFGSLNISATGDILDNNGNGPNFIVGGATFTTSGGGNLGSSSDPLEASITGTLNTSGVTGQVFLAPLYNAPNPGAAAGVIIEGNKITGGDNYLEFVTDSSITTEPGTEPDSGTDEKKEEEGDLPDYVNPGAVLTPPPAVQPPTSFPQEKPVQPSTFSPCANA